MLLKVIHCHLPNVTLAACFTQGSWHTYRFTVAFVSGRHDLPSDERALSLTSIKNVAIFFSERLFTTISEPAIISYNKVRIN